MGCRSNCAQPCQDQPGMQGSGVVRRFDRNVRVGRLLLPIEPIPFRLAQPKVGPAQQDRQGDHDQGKSDDGHGPGIPGDGNPRQADNQAYEDGKGDAIFEDYTSGTVHRSSRAEKGMKHLDSV